MDQHFSTCILQFGQVKQKIDEEKKAKRREQHKVKKVKQWLFENCGNFPRNHIITTIRQKVKDGMVDMFSLGGKIEMVFE